MRQGGTVLRLHLDACKMMMMIGIYLLYKREKMPIARQSKCWFRVRGLVLMGWPPYWTRRICTMIVEMMMPMKRKLLKKPANMLNSIFPNLRALISLKTCMKTKVLNIIV